MSLNIIIFILFIILILIICNCICHCRGVANNLQRSHCRGVANNLQRSHCRGFANNLQRSHCRGFANKYGGIANKYGGIANKYGVNTHYETNPEALRVSDVCTRISYTISGEAGGLDFSQLRQVLKDAIKYGVQFIEHPVSDKVHVSFGSFITTIINGKSTLGAYDPLFFKQHAAIKNALGDDKKYRIVNKSDLYSTINKLIPNGIKYLPKSYTPEEFEKQATPANEVSPISQLCNNVSSPLKQVFILKKDYGVQQFGVKIITSKDEYFKAKKELHIKNNAVVSEYITNPLLLDSKKMHLRVYYLLSVISGISRCIVHDEYRIHLAEKEYKKDDWLNTDIHISGALGRSTNRRYYWPDDVASVYDINLIKEKMSDFNKVMCLAIAISNAKNFSESYAGYHLYGADVMITDDFQIYLIEVNIRPSFKFAEHEKDWELASKKFSHKLFSFILQSTVFPFFGIVRPPIYTAEFVGNGTLSPFGDILTGNNRCILIPYLTATKSEIDTAKKMNFYNNKIALQYFIENCHNNNIFLISCNNLALNYHHAKILGYIVLDKEHFLSVVIMEEYQNRGIATAMVAQLIEILYSRQYTKSHHDQLYILHDNIFMNKIANTLLFKKNGNKYEFNYKTLTDRIIHHKNKEHTLTYRIIYGEPNIVINFDVNKYMIESHSQFVNFVYNLIPNTLHKKHSTGNRYNKDFIYQGAELKSSLKIPILFNILSLKLWIQTIFDDNIFDKKTMHIFDKIIKIQSDIILDNNYSIIDIKDIKNNGYKIVKGRDLIPEHYDIKKYLISEYYKPYLLDEKFCIFRYHFLIYNSGNGVLKFFVFPKYLILTAKNSYNELENTVVNCTTTDKKYDISNIDISNIDISNIDNIFTNFFELLSQYDIKPYPESNSGFLECSLQIKFIKKNDSNKYTPVIKNVFNWCGVIKKNNIIDDQFVKEYYSWVQNCVILPHFGLLSHKNIIRPNYGTIINSQIFPLSNNIIQYSIIEKIYLEFINAFEIDVFSDNRMQSIGRIKLHIKENEIYIASIDIASINIASIDVIKINIIFILMGLLRAYYAPIQMFLLLKYEKKMDNIAFELEFAKKNDYYVKKC